MKVSTFYQNEKKKQFAFFLWKSEQESTYFLFYTVNISIYWFPKIKLSVGFAEMLQEVWTVCIRSTRRSEIPSCPVNGDPNILVYCKLLH